MNIYVKQASRFYNRNRFEIENKHIQCIKSIWYRDDIIQEAKNKNIKLTDDEIDEILFLLIEEHNAEQGINWDVIDYWIDEIISARRR